MSEWRETTTADREAMTEALLTCESIAGHLLREVSPGAFVVHRAELEDVAATLRRIRDGIGAVKRAQGTHVRRAA